MLTGPERDNHTRPAFATRLECIKLLFGDHCGSGRMMWIAWATEPDFPSPVPGMGERLHCYPQVVAWVEKWVAARTGRSASKPETWDTTPTALKGDFDAYMAKKAARKRAPGKGAARDRT